MFWGAFAIDSHAAINTGWPTLIDMGDVCFCPPPQTTPFILLSYLLPRLMNQFDMADHARFAPT